MKVRSQRYRDLEQEIRVLRRLLLPRTLSAIGAYPDRVYTKVLSFRVLVHAEIEAYLEDRARELCLEALRKYKMSKRVTTSAAALLAFSGLRLDHAPEYILSADPAKQTKLDEKLYIEKKLDKATSCFFYVLGNNHGVKEKDLLSLLLPIGVNPAGLDHVWLQSMNSFGSDRGIVAHSTRASYGATALPDPQNELLRVRNLLVGLRDVDTTLNTLLTE